MPTYRPFFGRGVHRWKCDLFIDFYLRPALIVGGLLGVPAVAVFVGGCAVKLRAVCRRMEVAGAAAVMARGGGGGW